MGPKALAQVLRPIADLFDPSRYPDLLRGLDPPDDALVWRLDDERALVQTADFFPPVVDDPYAFGAIAAANAISDIYAMGGEPLFAMNLVGFPDGLDPRLLTEILRGGGEKVREAGAVVAGGHTTVDKEPKYGLAVTGIVHPDRILAKGGARPGDVLLLTKPLGTGIVTTAHKKEKAEDSDLAGAIESMTRLSAGAARLLRDSHPHVHALTDVTGFALLGHAHEMADQSGCLLEIDAASLPLLPGARRYAERGYLTGGAARNAEHCEPFLEWRGPEDRVLRAILYDPQTSGGLRAAVDPSAADGLFESFRAAGEPVHRIGRAAEGRGGGLRVLGS